ncbi:MAG: N-6 DNA methylase [Candidatus Cloacimonadaceae bacterium]|jgi:hypothetical protein|nr:N-6 DNA methylase [Candidatus Cloacimonadaceae bacterium]
MQTSKQSIKMAISQSLNQISESDFYPAIMDFWAVLAYTSERQPELYEYDYISFQAEFDANKTIKASKVKSEEWQSFYLLFQITDSEIGDSFQTELFDQKSIDPLLKSYLFAALELKGEHYSRSTLADISRQINRCFAIPLIISFKHKNKISIAVVDRRKSKLDNTKDVLEKVTFIRDIHLKNTHRAHLDILYELSIHSIKERYPLSSFDDLHKAWAKVLDLKELNKRFYDELSNWYFWAVQNVSFPAGEEKQEEKRNSISVIRLITRMFFVWFMKEKHLVPEELFDYSKIKTMLNFSDPADSSYYKAILQNLFFATLNTEMNHSGAQNRRFRMESNGNYNPDFNNHCVYRYRKLFVDADQTIQDYFLSIPFLNGGLFECLDTEKKENGRNSYIRIDGFSDRKDNPLKVPDKLFFQDHEKELDLNEVYGTKGKRYKVKGLLGILHSYKFTVAENTPIEEEIALDPELLGRVFENLLASYNPETKSTARKETGSFYTPRDVVDFMVDQALTAYLSKAIPAISTKQRQDNELRVRLLLGYSDEEHLFDDPETDLIIAAIDGIRAIDPACGSGAFLMGLLLKMVYILHKLDPKNDKWKAQQIARLQEQLNSARLITDYKVRNELQQKLKDSIEDVSHTFEDYDYDYSRKLFLIERCIYGSDIQPIAIQIAKLRFFLSLLVDEQKRPDRPNLGLRALPNLETKLVAADSLIRLHLREQLDIFSIGLEDFLSEIKDIHNEYFTARNRKHKLEIRQKENYIRRSFAQNLISDGTDEKLAEKIARWNPYASNEAASFFDLMIMFGVTKMNLVIANPPYIRQEDILNKQQLKASGYEVFNSTSDLYTYFYELSLMLLSEGGVAAFITSNKWLKAKYGTKLRKLLKDQATLHSIIDFGGYKVFESATVDTNILIYEKGTPPKNHKFGFLNIDPQYDGTGLGDYFLLQQQSISQMHLEDSGWTLADSRVLKLKAKIEAKGKPLKDWDVNIYYGIKTGCNEAFVIDTATKEKLCQEDLKSAEIIKPILRGRDINRYYYKWAGLWVIATFPALNICIDDYPAVKNYLASFGKRLEQTGKKGSRKKTNNKWFETQDTIAYYDEFEKEKIVWQEIAKDNTFSYDKQGMFNLDTSRIMTGSYLKAFLALFNSKFFLYTFSKFYAGGSLGSKGVRFKSEFMKDYPIPENFQLLLEIEKEADKLLHLRNLDNPSSSDKDKLIAEQDELIDRLIFQLYDLTPDEISLIEPYGG